jgi:hypothetical protein
VALYGFVNSLISIGAFAFFGYTGQLEFLETDAQPSSAQGAGGSKLETIGANAFSHVGGNPSIGFYTVFALKSIGPYAFKAFEGECRQHFPFVLVGF